MKVMLDQNVVWLKQADKDDIFNLGSHGAKLGELSREGIPIPEGFIVTTHAFNNFIRENNLPLKAKHLLSTVNFNDPNSLNQVSQLIKKYFVLGNLSTNFKLDLYNAYKKLGGSMTDAKVKVTHSTTHDKPHHEKHKHIKDVKGESSLIQVIMDFWASNFSEINIIQNNHFRNSANSILVQKLIIPDLSGKIYTIDPINNDKSKIIIKATNGEFDEKVNLRTSPDHFEIDKKSHMLISSTLSPRNNKSSRFSILQRKNKAKRTLLSNDIENLVNIAKLAEKFHYFPQEIDWSMEKGKIYFTNIKSLTI